MTPTERCLTPQESAPSGCPTRVPGTGRDPEWQPQPNQQKGTTMNTASNDLLERQLASSIAPPSSTEQADRRSRLASRADAEGLLDVAYTWADSPVGSLLIAGTPAGVVRVAFDTETRDEVLVDLAARISPRLLEATPPLDPVRRQLDEYFAGHRTRFQLEIDWRLSAGFRRQVLAATALIPYGHTGTYRSVATAAGSPNAVRAAGTALATNPVPIIVPCHRVVRSDGKVGGYGGGPERKELLLTTEAEGSEAGGPRVEG
jgi:methylated-DNA-[protein]-cysteine S-methyltransferase